MQDGDDWLQRVKKRKLELARASNPADAGADSENGLILELAKSQQSVGARAGEEIRLDDDDADELPKVVGAEDENEDVFGGMLMSLRRGRKNIRSTENAGTDEHDVNVNRAIAFQQEYDTSAGDVKSSEAHPSSKIALGERVALSVKEALAARRVSATSAVDDSTLTLSKSTPLSRTTSTAVNHKVLSLLHNGFRKRVAPVSQQSLVARSKPILCVETLNSQQMGGVPVQANNDEAFLEALDAPEAASSAPLEAAPVIDEAPQRPLPAVAAVASTANAISPSLGDEAPLPRSSVNGAKRPNALAKILALATDKGKSEQKHYVGRDRDNTVLGSADDEAKKHGIELEYRDAAGNLLTTREAFKLQSRQFHRHLGRSTGSKQKRNDGNDSE